MESYLSDWIKQYVYFSDINSNNLSINMGVSQGSILGPLLFLIHINDIVNATSSFWPIIYADDTTLGVCISYFGEVKAQIHGNINFE